MIEINEFVLEMLLTVTERTLLFGVVLLLVVLGMLLLDDDDSRSLCNLNEPTVTFKVVCIFDEEPDIHFSHLSSQGNLFCLFISWDMEMRMFMLYKVENELKIV